MKLIDFLVCEDIRQEINGKVSLIGVFQDKIIFPKEIVFPVGIRLAFFLRFVLDNNDDLPNRFQFVIRVESNEIAKFGGTLEIQDRLQPISLVLAGPSFSIPQTGILKASLILFKNDENLQEIPPIRDISIESLKS